MSFLLANAGIIALVIVAVAVVILGFVVVPILVKKGLTPNLVHDASGMLSFIETLTGHMNLGVAQGRTGLVLGVAETAVNYVEQIMRLGDNKAKKDKAVETATTILNKFGVTVSPEDQSLLDIGIESAVNKLAPTNPVVVTPVVNVSATPTVDAQAVAQQVIKQVQQAQPQDQPQG